MKFLSLKASVSASSSSPHPSANKYWKLVKRIFQIKSLFWASYQSLKQIWKRPFLIWELFSKTRAGSYLAWWLTVKKNSTEPTPLQVLNKWWRFILSALLITANITAIIPNSFITVYGMISNASIVSRNADRSAAAPPSRPNATDEALCDVWGFADDTRMSRDSYLDHHEQSYLHHSRRRENFCFFRITVNSERVDEE